MEHIIGATFRKVCVYKNDLGVAQNITNIDIQVQIYTLERVLLATLVVTKLEPTLGIFQMRTETAGFPAGYGIFDFRYVINGDIVFTDSTKVRFIESFTKPA